jgi:plastocyanin
MKSVRPTIGPVPKVLAAALLACGLALVALAPFALAAQSAISIVDKSFDPADVTVDVGDTVVWTVTKAIAEPHSVTSGAPGNASGQVFDSGIKLQANGDTFQFQFQTPGNYPFYCQVHPTEMHGTITVLAAGQSAAPAASTTPAASAAPAASPAPGPSSGASATQAPATGEPRTPIGTTEKLAAAAVIGVALVILFGAARLYRRANG